MPGIIHPAVKQVLRYKASAPAAAPSIFTFQGTDSSTSDLTAYTFASKDILTAAANRRVMVGGMLGRSGAGTVSSLVSLSIGGNAATIVRQRNIGDSVIFLASATVASGSTGDIVVTGDAAAQRCMIGYWVAYIGSNTAANSDDQGYGNNISATSNSDFSGGGLGAFSAGFAVAVGGIDGGDTTDRTGSIDQGFRTPTELFIESQNVWFSDKTVTTADSNITAGYATTPSDVAGYIIANWAA